MKNVALVTGGTRGIGLGIALALAREGYDLALCGMRDASAVTPVLASLKALGAEAAYFQADVSRRDARFRLLQDVQRRFGRLNLLVNNAGIAPPERKDILEAEEDAFELVMRTNLQGPYFLTQAAARWMIEQRQADAAYRAAVVFITSISSTVASIQRGEYCVSKAGLSMAVRLFAVRLAEFDIPVYEIRPGITETDMTAGVKAKYDRLIEDGLTLQRRWGTPDDVGRAVALLARGDLPYSTGQVLGVDGGLTLQRL